MHINNPNFTNKSACAEKKALQEQSLNDQKKYINGLRICNGHSEKVCFEPFELIEPAMKGKKILKPYIIPPPKENEMTPELKPCPTPKTLENIRVTEEGLDDWFAQSMNRNLKIMLLAHKEFYIPPSVSESLQKRYKSVDASSRLQAKNGPLTYFPPSEEKLGKNKKLSSKLILADPGILLFDSNLLKPLDVPEGTPQQVEITQMPNRLLRFNSINPSKGIIINNNNNNNAPKTPVNNSFRAVESRKNIFKELSVIRSHLQPDDESGQLSSSSQIVTPAKKLDKRENSKLHGASPVSSMILELREKRQVNKALEPLQNNTILSPSKSRDLAYTAKAAHILREDLEFTKNDELLDQLTKELSLAESAQEQMIQQLKEKEKQEVCVPIDQKAKKFKNNIMNYINKISEQTIQEIKTKNPHERYASRLKKDQSNNSYQSQASNQVKLSKGLSEISDSDKIASIQKNLQENLTQITPAKSSGSSFKGKNASPTKGIHNLFTYGETTQRRLNTSQDIGNSPPKEANIFSIASTRSFSRGSPSASASPKKLRSSICHRKIEENILSEVSNSVMSNVSPLRNRIRRNRLTLNKNAQGEGNSTTTYPFRINLESSKYPINIRVGSNHSPKTLLDEDRKSILVQKFYTRTQQVFDFPEDPNKIPKFEKNLGSSPSHRQTTKSDIEVNRIVTNLLNDIETQDTMIEETNAYDEQTAVYNKKLDIKKLSLHTKGHIELNLPYSESHMDGIDELDWVSQQTHPGSNENRDIALNDGSRGGNNGLDDGVVKTNMSNSYVRQRNISISGGKIQEDYGNNHKITHHKRTSSSSTNPKKKKTNESDNIEFWFLRGMIQMKKNNLYNAIDCFKQVLLLDSQYYICIFNIGCMYERLNNFEAAKKWLKLSLDLGFNIKETLYGIALCEFKTTRFSEAYSILLTLESISDNLQLNVVYLLALCAREMRDYIRSSNYYKIVNNKIKENLRMNISNVIMAYCILKLKKHTMYKLNSKLLNKFKVSYQQYISYDNHIYYLHDYYTEDQGWKYDQIQKIAQMIKTLGFWKRFPIEFIYKFIKYIKLQILPAESIYFLKEDEVCIISRGIIVLRDHSNNFLDPNVMTFYQEGDIFGFDEIDRFVCRRVEVWLYSLSNVELIIVNKNDFIKIWKAQVEFNRFIYMNLGCNLDIFKSISDKTIYVMFYELFVKETRKQNEIIYNDNSYLIGEQNSEVKEDKLNRQNSIRKRRESLLMPSYNRMIMERYYSTSSDDDDIDISSYIKVKRVNKTEKIEAKGLYIILQGECNVENNDGRIMTILTAGDYFGEKLLFDTMSVTDFGLIRVRSEVIELLFLNKTMFDKLPYYEIDLMRRNCLDRKIIKNLQNILKIKSMSL